MMHALDKLAATLLQTTYLGVRLHYFSWPWYAMVVALYSLFVFFDEIPKDRRVIFSKGSRWRPIQVMALHLGFLAVLVCGLQACAPVAHYLPEWMTHEFDDLEGYLSVAGCLVFVGIASIAGAEKLILGARRSEGDGSLQ
jgi:hypothetical protein